MAYGWPQVIPLESGLGATSSGQIVYLKVLNRLLLVVSPSHIELWSSSQVRKTLLWLCLRNWVTLRSILMFIFEFWSNFSIE